MVESFLVVVSNADTARAEFRVIANALIRKDGIASGDIYIQGKIADTFSSLEEAISYVRYHN